MTIKVENLLEGYDTHQLTFNEIRYLLSAAGAAIAPNSPLGGIPSIKSKKKNDDPKVLESLKSKGLLSDDDPPHSLKGVLNAIEVLADPGWIAKVQMGNWDEFIAASFYGKDSLSDKSLVNFKVTQDKTSDISFFMSKEHVLALMEPYVQLDALTMYLPQKFTLNFEEFFVILAISDAYRQASLEALLDRKLELDWKVNEEDIESALFKGFAYIDPRWLVSIAHVTLPFPYSWESGKVRAGLQGLVQKGLLEPITDASAPTYTMGYDLEVFCGANMTVTGFATIQVDKVLENGKRGLFYISLLRTPSTIWLIGYNDLLSENPTVTIFSAEGFFISQAIAELFERSGAPKPSAPLEAEKEHTQCSACGSDQPEDSKFCSNCGQKMEKKEKAVQPEMFCKSCGNEMKPGSKFCPNCGLKIEPSTDEKDQPPPIPEKPKTCANCSAELSPGKKFCTNCGTKI